jgi:hypothetical protein
MKSEKIKVSALQPHDAVIEIRSVNTMTVSRYRIAMRNGDTFPPVTIDQDNRIVSGCHRHAAALAEFGEDHQIEAIRKTYADEAERIEDAITENARHGMPLDGWSRKKAAHRLAELGRDEKAIANLLGVSVRRVHEMGGETVFIRGQGNRRTAVPVKRGLEHLVGQTVTKSQYEAHANHHVGKPVYSLAKQLTDCIESGWIDRDNAATMAQLEQLHAALETFLNQ